MKAILCSEPGRLTLIDRPEPVRGEGDVLVRIRRVGMCGTDYHIYHGDQPYLTYPRVIGHELSGEVVEAPKESAFTSGDRVAIEPYLYCGRCRACARGLTNCCQSLRVLGVHQDGGLCEFVSVPERNVIAAGDLTLDQAAMLEFLAIGAHGVRRARVGPESRILVVGAGPIGVAATIFAKARGAEVHVADLNLRRLAFVAEALGAPSTHPGGVDLNDRLAAATDGDFFDAVIDATGSPAAMQAGFALVGHGGAYLFLSIVRGLIAFDDPEFHKRETTLLASRNATREDFEVVIDALRSGAVPDKALATHRGAIDEAVGAIPIWARPESGVIKALIEV
jgi:2-desacetyl-2-hydroxyethyl bacteriochlorophyllide A dehydrogenase